MKSDTEKAKRIRTNVTQLNQQASAKAETLKTLEDNINHVEHETNKLNDIFREINLTGDQIQQIINKRDFYQSTLNSLKDHISNRPESTEELKRLLKLHQSSENNSQREKSVLLNEKDQLQKKLKKANEELIQKHSIMGRLEAASEEYDRQINIRKELIQSINDLYNYNLPLQDGDKSLTVLKKSIKLKSLQYEKRKKEAMTKQNILSDELQLLKSRLLSIGESKKHLISRIEQEKIQINVLEEKIKNYQVSNNEIDDLKDKIEEYKQKYNQLNSNLTNPNIIQKERELRELDDKVYDLNEELSTLSKQGDIRAKLSLIREEKESKETILNRFYLGCIDDVEKLIGSKPNIDQLEKNLYEYKREKENQLRELIERRNKTQRELSNIDGKLNMVKQNLIQKQKEANKYESMCQQVCGDKNVPDEIQQTEVKMQEIKGRISNVSAVDSIYGKFLVGTTEHKCCPLCCRGFNDDNELQVFANGLDQKKKGFPVVKLQMEATLTKLNTRLDKLKTVHGAWIKLEQLRKDISSIQVTVDTLNHEREKAAELAEIASIKQRDVDNCKIKADNLFTIAGNISRIHKEILTASDEISVIETELRFSGSTRTITDCQKDLEQISDQSKIVRRDIKRIQTDIENVRRQANLIDTTIREHEKKLSGLEHKLDFKVGLNFQLEELNEQLIEHINECKSIEMDVEPLTQKVSEATRKYEEELKSFKLIEETCNKEENEMSRYSDRLEECNNSISRNELSSNSNRANQVKKELEDLQSFTKSITEQVCNLENRISIIEKEETDRRGIERDLQDHIRYRQTEIELKLCDEELSELEERQGEIDIRKLKKELEKLQSEEASFIDKRGSVRGELSQMKDQIKRYENELVTHYSDVDTRYANLFIETKTLEIAIADLTDFNKTWGKAVMQMHSLMMTELNKIIKDLWFKTYKGGDIDYIAIKADSEQTAKNRSFNYRVVMYQNENELDMRGRCSAGQKVLASIIIRLALAETFCVKCGFFTLDEPTTNLDKENVKSLAANLRL